MRFATLGAIVALALVGAVQGVPVDDGASSIDALRENVTALWQEVGKLKEALQSHIQGMDHVTSFSTDHHHDYDHYHDHHFDGTSDHAHHHSDLGDSPHDHDYHHNDHDHHHDDHDHHHNDHDHHHDDHDHHHNDHDHHDADHDHHQDHGPDHHDHDHSHGPSEDSHGHSDHHDHGHDEDHGHSDHHDGPYDDDHDHSVHHDGAGETHDHPEDHGGEEDEDEPLEKKKPMMKCKKCKMMKKMKMMMMKKASSQAGQHDSHHHHHHHHHQRSGSDPGHPDVLEAHCHLQPNIEVPESNISGHITITQRGDWEGPLYFDLEIEGFPVEEGQSGSIHGFHVHQYPVKDQKCSTAGPHFNPTGSTHGAPLDVVRHVGDLGNIRSDSEGKLENYIMTDRISQFRGEQAIIGRSIVVHALADDLGKGGDEGSLKTGNAGSRLSCCVIKAKNFSVSPHKSVIRFNG